MPFAFGVFAKRKYPLNANTVLACASREPHGPHGSLTGSLIPHLLVR